MFGILYNLNREIDLSDEIVFTINAESPLTTTLVFADGANEYVGGSLKKTIIALNVILPSIRIIYAQNSSQCLTVTIIG